MAVIDTTTTPPNNNPASLICRLCEKILTKPGCSYFLDKPDVEEAIKTNDPKKLTEMTHYFIQNALTQIELLIKEGTRITLPESLSIWTRKQMRNNFGHFMVCADSSSFHLESTVGLRDQVFITVQLMLWSCFSKDISNCIVKTLREFKFKPSQFWSCLHCVIYCVSGTVKCVYNKYARPHEMEHPCEVLLLASSIYHIFSSFILLIEEESTSNNGSPPKPMDEMLRVVTESYLSFLKGMTKLSPVEPRSGKDYRLDFFVDELGLHSNSWNLLSHIITCIARCLSIKIHYYQIQTKDRFMREYSIEFSRFKRKCR